MTEKEKCVIKDLSCKSKPIVIQLSGSLKCLQSSQLSLHVPNATSLSFPQLLYLRCETIYSEERGIRSLAPMLQTLEVYVSSLSSVPPPFIRTPVPRYFSFYLSDDDWRAGRC